MSDPFEPVRIIADAIEPYLLDGTKTIAARAIVSLRKSGYVVEKASTPQFKLIAELRSQIIDNNKNIELLRTALEPFALSDLNREYSAREHFLAQKAYDATDIIDPIISLGY